MIKKYKLSVIFVGLALLYVAGGIWLAYSIPTVSTLNEENKQLTQQVNEYEQKALDWQIKAEDYEIKLLEAQMDLELCSKEIERLETLNYSISEEMSMLKKNEEDIEEISEYVFNGEWNYEYAQDDIDILAAVMYGEEYPNRYEMMLAGSVVLNRVLSTDFPNNIHDVVYQKSEKYEQYAPRTKGFIGKELPEECYRLAEILLQYGPIAPKNVVYQAHFNQGRVFWEWKGEEFCFG